MRKEIPWEFYLKNLNSSTCLRGFTVLDFIPPYQGIQTKVVAICNEGHEWKSSTIATIQKGCGCPVCAIKERADKNAIAEDVVIDAFFATGSYKEGTLFCRSQKTTSRGWSRYWVYKCPVCANDEFALAGACTGVFETTVDTLMKGGLTCRCAKNPKYSKEQWEFKLSKHCVMKGYSFVRWESEDWGVKKKIVFSCPHHGEQITTPNSLLNQGKGCPKCKGKTQRFMYINKVWDTTGKCYALKFGIANDPNKRLENQNRVNIHKMTRLHKFFFVDVDSCQNMERLCKSRFYEEGLVKKKYLEDGYTETTDVRNLEAIVQLIMSPGNVKIDT